MKARLLLYRWNNLFGRELLLALLLHLLLLVALMHTKLDPAPKRAPVEPIVSYLYQPPAVTLDIVVEPTPVADPTTAQAADREGKDSRVLSAPPAAVTAKTKSSNKAATQVAVAETAITTPVVTTSLAQRALQRAATTSPAQMEQAAARSYQQYLSTQQEVKLTVEKRHQQLSSDPAKQVIAQLDNGLQLIRTKDGCRIGDPSKDGFDALMAAGRAPCGDEISNKELLKQALEKHIKR